MFRAVLRCGVPLLVATALSAVPSAAGAAARPDPGDRIAHRAGDKVDAATQARKVLSDVRNTVRDGADRPSKDLTVKLRDLRVLRTRLSRAERAEADRILARPADRDADPEGDGWNASSIESTICEAAACVHYLDAANAANGADPSQASSEFAAATSADAESVLAEFTAAGYRAPKPDGVNGGDAKLDIYLADIGDFVYGYCSTDDPNVEDLNYPGYDGWAFCVLDNDYDASQFGSQWTPTENRQVTVAHELFHAVQFAYDVYEDDWLIEGTATWVEDELYDSVDQNRSFLNPSPLTHPSYSLDLFDYGDWMFFRFLSERYPATTGNLPTIIRSIWERADDAATVPDAGADRHASIYAVREAVKSASGSKYGFVRGFADFGANNRRPTSTYAEGSFWPAAGPQATHYLHPTGRALPWKYRTLAQLSNQTVRFTPYRLWSRNWKLAVWLDLPSTWQGSAATAQVYYKDGRVSRYPLALDSTGRVSKVFWFTTSVIKYVEVTLTNAGTRYSCWEDSSYSCAGQPLDNNLKGNYKATAYE